MNNGMMTSKQIRTLDELVVKARMMPEKKIIAVAVAHDLEVLLAVSMARDAGIAKAILIGDTKKIRDIARDHKISLDDMELFEELDGKKACEMAVRFVSANQADVLMKGLIDTSVLLSAVLDKEHGLRTDRVLSHVAIAEIDGYDRLFLISDAAMNIAPDINTKINIVHNAIDVAHGLGNLCPKVAIIGAVEKVNEKMQATLDAKTLVSMYEAGKFADCMIGGPFALDNAVSIEASAHKGIEHPVAGKADILIMPAIETGNVLYKAIVFFARGKMAGLIAGAKAPIVLTSRSDSEQSKLYSIASAIVLSEKR